MKKNLPIKTITLHIFFLLFMAYCQYGLATIRIYAAHPDIDHKTEIIVKEIHFKTMLDARDIPMIKSYLQTHNAVKILFDNVSFQTFALGEITEFLNQKSDQTKTILAVFESKIDKENMKEIASGIKNNGQLVYLELRRCEISDEELFILAEALESNNTLKRLDLSSNNIGDKGAQRIAELLKHNNTLKYLDLRGNRIKEVGERALKEAHKLNPLDTFLF